MYNLIMSRRLLFLAVCTINIFVCIKAYLLDYRHFKSGDDCHHKPKDLDTAYNSLKLKLFNRENLLKQNVMACKDHSHIYMSFDSSFGCFPCDSTSSTDCFNHLLGMCAFNTWPCRGRYMIPVHAAETEFLRKDQSKPRSLLMSNLVYVTNNSSIQQKGLSPQFTKEVQNSRELSYRETQGVKVSSKFNIPFLGETGIEVSVGFELTQTYLNSVTEIVTFPPQEVQVPPFSKVQLSFEVYETEYTIKFSTNFTIDSSNSLISNCIKNLHQPPFEKEIHFQLRNNNNTVGMILNNDIHILMNIPTQLVSHGYETIVSIGEIVPIDYDCNTIDLIRHTDASNLQSLHLNS